MAELVSREGNKVTFKVTVPAADVRQAFEGVFNALSREVRIPGFRPGKAPRGVLEKRVGKDFVANEVRERLFNQTYPNAIKELELIPVVAEITEAGNPTDGQDFEFTVNAENYPSVTLPAWRGFSIEAATPEVSDEDVNKTLENLRQARASYDPVEREAGAEDLVDVEILEGEDAGQSYPVYLERSEENVRGALLGKKTDDVLSIDLGEGGALSVKVLGVKAKTVPALDDGFAKELELETLAELTARVKTDLLAQAGQRGLEAKKDEFAQKLADGMSADIPNIMFERRKRAIETDLGNDLERQGANLEAYREYLKNEGEDKLAEFESSIGDNAQKLVRRDLALEALGEELSVKVEDEEWKQALSGLAQSNRVSVARMLEALGENGVENYREAVKRDKAMNLALEALGVKSA